ncbi:type IX secretion system motor protein PorM/GldM [Flavobacterium laiguense]|uniref:Gliding motility protein GldM n=1 Tax=Flavobacterium laiguense TaxID=2169409 RepID=A0A2U1JTY6_9FLAO|nr:gliding motility protein GldM [Flavobacterium laiguense]PWA08308.1 gliding motility protein GldM [Flavobacterium laiguense]
MAGGKLTPRQKMINLMYLVFIAMLALNMSKEVLSAFGLMNEKFEKVNSLALDSNEAILADLQSKAQDKPEQYAAPRDIAVKVSELTKIFYDKIGSLKNDLTKGIEKEKDGKLPYESMDASGKLDESWFSGDGLSAKGKDIMASIEAYKAGMVAALGKDPKYSDIVAEINGKLETKNVIDKEGVSKIYLDYHFKHFPLIASVAKLTAVQNDIKGIETNVFNALTGNTAVKAASMKNYTAIVVPEKSAFFTGEAVRGTVYLGRFDKSTVPTAVSVSGGSTKIENGQASFSIGAGNVGEHEIKGSFTFMEDGKPVPIPIKGSYVVVPRPNSATISADKMNVVYRGVVNPMTITFAGVSSDKISASAPGLSSAGKAGSYNMNPGQGSEVVINVAGTLPDGSKVSDRKSFRIKGIPPPVGAIGGEMGIVKGAKSRLQVSQISAKLPDFDFNVQLNVVGFTLKVAGQAAVIVSGDRVNAQCNAALARATRGDQVTISDIKTKLVGSDIMLSRTAPVIYEIQ